MQIPRLWHTNPEADQVLDPFADEDDSAHHRVPTRPSELRTLTDEEIASLMRKVAFANYWPISSQVEYEMMARNIAALKAFQRTSKWTGIALIVLTLVLIVLTGAIVWLTYRL